MKQICFPLNKKLSFFLYDDYVRLLNFLSLGFENLKVTLPSTYTTKEIKLLRKFHSSQKMVEN